MKPLELVERCYDCGASIGELHEFGCDVERCPRCGHQMISEVCGQEHKGMEGRIPWDGLWPGVRECREYGMYVVTAPNGAFQRSREDAPGAREDLNALVTFAEWDPAQKRYIMSDETLKLYHSSRHIPELRDPNG